MITGIDYIEGSSSEIVKAGTFINGQQVDVVGLSVLAKYGMIQIVGKQEKVEGRKGKPGNIYRIPVEMIKVVV